MNKKIYTTDRNHVESTTSTTTDSERKFEIFDKDVHLNELIEKPWGFEYRVYCDDTFDIWRLHIKTSQSTSMHCHANKDTVLICLSGSGETRFLNGEMHNLTQGSNVYITKGIYHQTISSVDQELQLIEIENPRNKYDLIRLSDNYGRENTSYEKKSVSDDSLVNLKEIDAGSFMRSEDLTKYFKFSTGHFTQKELLDKKIRFIIGINRVDHKPGEIRISNHKDNALKEFIGKKTFMISDY